MPNFDENVSLQQGSDTGQANADSIQPIGPSEVVWGGTDNRPLENLRERTEILRRYMQNVLYYLDYDRCLLLRSDASFTLTEPSAGEYELAMVGDDLWVYPSLTPGRNSGGRVRGGRVFVAGLPYSGTALVNDLILTASAQYTGQRGYFDADDFTTADSLTLGANRIVVDLVADAALATGVFAYTVTEEPATRLTIRYGTNGGTTTLAALIAAINGDLTSQGTYGVAHFVRATTTAAAPGAVFPAPFTDGVVQGAYDAEAHQVTAAQLAAFFAATEGGVQVNRLREGEGLAVGYAKGPVETGVPTPRGGRRQSIWDLPTDRIGGLTTNITPTVGWAVFSTGREPEKIPGAVPLGKLLNGEFVFLDGTRVGVGETIQLGESRVMRAALASTVFGTSGATLVGYDGSGFWNADAAASPNPSVAAGTVESALDAIVAQLAASTSGASGARRTGSEALTGITSTGNVGLSLIAGSLRTALAAVLNTLPTSGSVGGGINYRVNELGHALHGPLPLEKNFREVAPINLTSGGAVMLRTELNGGAGANPAYDTGHVYEDALQAVAPIAYDLGGGLTLAAPETLVSGAPAGALTIAAMNTARGTRLALALSGSSHNWDGVQTSLVMVRLTGCTPSTFNAWYHYVGATPGATTTDVALMSLDGTVPDFTTLTVGSITFYHGLEVGSDSSGHRVRGFYVGNKSFMELGAYGTTSPLIRMWDEVSVLSNKPSIFYSDHAVWQSTSIVRNTENILGGTDKNLLDGVEDGAPVDATANHHHGGAYTRTAFLAAAVGILGTTALNALGAPTLVTASGTIPADYDLIAAIINVTVNLAVSGTPAAGTRCSITIDVAKVGEVGVTLRPSFAATGGSMDSLFFQYQLVIPVSAADQFGVSLGGISEGIDEAASSIVIGQTGFVLRRI